MNKNKQMKLNYYTIKDLLKIVSFGSILLLVLFYATGHNFLFNVSLVNSVISTLLITCLKIIKVIGGIFFKESKDVKRV